MMLALRPLMVLLAGRARQRRFRRRRVLKLIADADQGRPALRRLRRLPVQLRHDSLYRA